MAKKPKPKKVVKVKPKKRITKKPVDAQVTAKQFIAKLNTYQSDVELEKIKRYFKSETGQYGAGDKFMGVRMGHVFAVAKEFMEMPLPEVEKLLESPVHEVRTGAVSIMDFHDRINNWDLVDRAAPHVVGGYLVDQPRSILYKLARSKNIWERRTSIVSTFYFIRQGDIDDTFKIAEILLNDREDLIHKAAGGWVREAGKRDPKKLLTFLNAHAATMPRTMLRYAIEHLTRKQRDYYLSLKDL
ncbi:MAG: DNA alkylation repair protein [Cyclobacteriaceae bacterium]